MKRAALAAPVPALRKPGLFVTATDTGVGKTVVTCAIALHLRRAGLRVGVCKPFASGCRRDREGLVSEDAEAIAHFADCRQPLDVINPIRYAQPVAPAVAAEQTGVGPDWEALARSLRVLDGSSDVMLVEGVGGLLVPLDERTTVLDLIRSLGYPVLIVARATLGTLNHTAMTVKLLRDAGCAVAGIAVNGYEPDARDQTDASMATNRQWLTWLTGAAILATVPRCPPEEVAPQCGKIPGAILDAVGVTYWPDVLAVPALPGAGGAAS